MSTKGMSNTASRLLVDRLCSRYDIPLLVVHDFDKAGFSIVGTLKRSTKRYQFENNIKVIDLGLRLSDVEEYDLEPEDVYYRMDGFALSKNLRKNGAAADEIDFLARQRVELNAFSSGDLIKWLEAKLEEHGIEKVVPGQKSLEEAYRHAIEAQYLEDNAETLLEEANEFAEAQPIPEDIAELVRSRLADHSTMSWDDAIEEEAIDNYSDHEAEAGE
jgi:hypothetical protein